MFSVTTNENISYIFGWLSFIAWSLSFYPQMILNYQLKSVAGIDIYFWLYNLSGWIFYTIYCLIYYIIENKEQHKVILSDVFFSTHAFILTLIITIQFYIYYDDSNYTNNNRKLNKYKVLLILIWSFLTLITLLVLLFNVFSFIFVLNVLGYLKMLITLVKYIPQVQHNYKRKSMIGFSMQNVYLDFSGGLFSLLQMMFIETMFDNIPKLLLT